MTWVPWLLKSKDRSSWHLIRGTMLACSRKKPGGLDQKRVEVQPPASICCVVCHRATLSGKRWGYG